MPEVGVYNQLGEKVKTVKLAKKIFGLEVKPHLIHQVAVARQANLRRPWAHTKTKGEVRGGGRKPWRQKGTGRARHGSIRSPLWRGGGITFGPRRERNFSQKINKKVNKTALLMTLSDKLNNSRLIVLEKIELKTAKTKIFSGLIKNLQKKIKNLGHKILFILPEKEEKLERSARNIKNLKIIKVNNLNIIDVLKYDSLLTTLAGVERIEKVFKSLS